jgi:hypothetical protein
MLQKPLPIGGGLFILATASACVLAYKPYKTAVYEKKLKTNLMSLHHANFTNFVA